jgi:hypothetical protein
MRATSWLAITRFAGQRGVAGTKPLNAGTLADDDDVDAGSQRASCAGTVNDSMTSPLEDTLQSVLANGRRIHL